MINNGATRVNCRHAELPELLAVALMAPFPSAVAQGGAGDEFITRNPHSRVLLHAISGHLDHRQTGGNVRGWWCMASSLMVQCDVDRHS